MLTGWMEEIHRVGVWRRGCKCAHRPFKCWPPELQSWREPSGGDAEGQNRAASGVTLCKKEQNVGETGILGRLQPTGSGRVNSFSLLHHPDSSRNYRTKLYQRVAPGWTPCRWHKGNVGGASGSNASTQINVCLIINALDTSSTNTYSTNKIIYLWMHSHEYAPKKILCLSDLIEWIDSNSAVAGQPQVKLFSHRELMVCNKKTI